MGIKEIYHSMFRWLGVALMILPLLSSCIREEEFNNSPQGNFEALWKIIDEQYCFLDYKQIDWDAIHDKYHKHMRIGMRLYIIYHGLLRIPEIG